MASYILHAYENLGYIFVSLIRSLRCWQCKGALICVP